MHLTRFSKCVRPAMVLAVLLFGLHKAARGADIPLFYYVDLASFAGGRTAGLTLNQAGQVAGVSGSAQTVVGMHPFLSDAGGALTDLNGLDYTTAVVGALSEFGHVAGRGSYHLGNDQWANSLFRYTPGAGLQDLGKLAGPSGGARGVNRHGDVAGTWDFSATSGRGHAVLYTDAGGLQDLGTLGGDQSWSMGLNDAGQVIGSAYLAPAVRHAFLWQNGVMADLGTLGRVSDAYDINEAGVVVGNSYSLTLNRLTGFVYSPATGMQAVPAPANAVNSAATRLTETGFIVGTWELVYGEPRVYRYSATDGVIDAGVPPGASVAYPLGVNNLGHIVGWARHAQTQADIAFFWSPETGMVDLSSAVSPPLSWRPDSAVAINDAGLILLTGWDAQNREKTAVLWPQRAGDLNCDGTVDFFDIDTFILALTDPAAHQAAFPGCDGRNADINQDGALDFFDLDPFLELLL